MCFSTGITGAAISRGAEITGTVASRGSAITLFAADITAMHKKFTPVFRILTTKEAAIEEIKRQPFFASYTGGLK